MATVKINYGTPVQVILDADGIAASGTIGWQASAIDNSAVNTTYGLADDYVVYGSFDTATGTLGTNPVVTLYVAPLADGSNYADGATGAAGTFTFPTAPVSIPIQLVPISVANTPVHVGQFSLAAAFGGTLPSKFAFWIENSTGLALAGTSLGNTANVLWVIPVTYTAA